MKFADRLVTHILEPGGLIEYLESRLRERELGTALTSSITKAGGFLRRELVAAWPVFVFFLTGFSLIILLVKLTLAKFSIEITVVSNATLGALIAAKAALILDETSLARRLDRHRRIVAVCVKTAIYGSATLLLGYVERYLEALHRTHSMAAAFGQVLSHANHYLLFAWALAVSIVFAAYFSVFEISQRIGPGELTRLFFDLPDAHKSSKELRSRSINRR